MKVFDFDKSVRFYADGFGFSIRYAWGEFPKRAAMIDIGSGDYIEIFEGGTPPGETPEGILIHFALRVPNANEAYAKALAAGAVSQMEPKDILFKGTPEIPIRIAFVRGPDNEVIEFFENEIL